MKKQSLIINEIPFMVNKAKMLEKIAELVKEKKVEGITEIRDESDKSGMREVIELKKADFMGLAQFHHSMFDNIKFPDG